MSKNLNYVTVEHNSVIVATIISGIVNKTILERGFLMDIMVAQTYLSDVLHVISQSLLVPDIALLLLFILYGLFSIGSLITELIVERSHFRVVIPRFLASLMEASEEEVPRAISRSGLLKRQKEALSTVYRYRALPGDALIALVRRLVNEEETRYDKITGRNATAAKVAPMLGLMGTLIPLGPGIQALGTADTQALSTSLLIAFDTTVAGLVTAAVCLVIGKIRGNWYNNYLSALDASMATLLEKIENNREFSNATLPGGKDAMDVVFDADRKDKKQKSSSDKDRSSNNAARARVEREAKREQQARVKKEKIRNRHKSGFEIPRGEEREPMNDALLPEEEKEVIEEVVPHKAVMTPEQLASSGKIAKMPPKKITNPGLSGAIGPKPSAPAKEAEETLPVVKIVKPVIGMNDDANSNKNSE